MKQNRFVPAQDTFEQRAIKKREEYRTAKVDSDGVVSPYRRKLKDRALLQHDKAAGTQLMEISRKVRLNKRIREEAKRNKNA